MDGGGRGARSAPPASTPRPASGTGADVVRAAAGGFSGTASVAVTGDGLFTGGADVGSPALPGYFSYSGPAGGGGSAGTYTITGGYSSSAGSPDNFQLANLPESGDATLIARVTSLTAGPVPATAGAMFRAGTGPTDPFAAVYLSPGNTVTFIYRTTAGGGLSSASASGGATPQWVKVSRTGNSFAGSYSADGVHWTQLGSAVTVAAPAAMLAGLAVTSANASAVATATFDNVSLNLSPTVAAAASASPSPVSGTSTALSALGADDGGESNLTYTWATTGLPPAPVAFSANGTNAAKVTTATFARAGAYNFLVTITDADGLSITSSVAVTVNQTLTSNQRHSGECNAERERATSVRRHRLRPVRPRPSPPSRRFTWSDTGVGSVGASGLYTAPGSGGAGSATVTAAAGGVSAAAAVTVNNAAPTVASAASASPDPVTGSTTTLSALGADDGGEPNLTYTWARSRLAARPRRLLRQRHQRRKEHHRRLHQGRHLQLPGDDHRRRGADRHQQRHRHGAADADEHPACPRPRR